MAVRRAEIERLLERHREESERRKRFADREGRVDLRLHLGLKRRPGVAARVDNLEFRLRRAARVAVPPSADIDYEAG